MEIIEWSRIYYLLVSLYHSPREKVRRESFHSKVFSSPSVSTFSPPIVSVSQRNGIEKTRGIFFFGKKRRKKFQSEIYDGHFERERQKIAKSTREEEFSSPHVVELSLPRRQPEEEWKEDRNSHFAADLAIWRICWDTPLYSAWVWKKGNLQLHLRESPLERNLSHSSRILYSPLPPTPSSVSLLFSPLKTLPWTNRDWKSIQ